MMVGFNTDITHSGIVYHVQTEPRKDAGIETTVYVGGAVIHTVRTSCQALLESSLYQESKLRELLAEQHRRVIAQLRAGEIGLPSTH